MNLKEIKKLYEYNPVTGIVMNLVTGKRAGSLNKQRGYRYISIKGSKVPEHRFIWFYMLGKFPENQIDHINGLRDDNTWNNLREVTVSENQQNRSINLEHTVGVKGISEDTCRQRFKARVVLNGIVKQKNFHFSTYSGKANALVVATNWVRTTREDLHKQYHKH